MRIVTTYTTVPGSNVGKVVAKGAGKQKSTRWDQSKNTAQNHGIAAANLLSEKFSDETVQMWVKGIPTGQADHDSNDSGTVHTFVV